LPLGIIINAIVRGTLGRFIPALRIGVIPWYHMAPPNPAEQYSCVPLHAVRELVRMAKHALRLARKVTVPIQVLHGTADATAAFAASQAYTAKVSQAQFTSIAGAPHDCLRANLNHSWATLSTLLNQPPAMAAVNTGTPNA
jgi:alpha-beta hydrolase superfamily lysophospholipase